MNLRRQSIVIAAPQELCFEVVAAAGRRLEKRSEVEWLVEFTTRAGDREVRTVELLILDRPEAIEYRWLEGPIPDMRETIGFVNREDGTTRVHYRGSFSLGKGPIAWLIGRFRVKRWFDRLVAEHLLQAKEVAETRARRTRVHTRNGRRSSK
ncbi:MAG: hypothetical protein GEU68_15700 [Actinobacteria bacterium]|nr:hypothetical protein [Actinomycetota bacterium]